MATSASNVSVSGKRTFKELRDTILKTLADGHKTINQLSQDSKINWKTVELHLTYLAGRGAGFVFNQP